jgi:hypothetical protein
VFFTATHYLNLVDIQSVMDALINEVNEMEMSKRLDIVSIVCVRLNAHALHNASLPLPMKPR